MMENYYIFREYYKCVLSLLIRIVNLAINLISETHNYVKMRNMNLWYSKRG